MHISVDIAEQIQIEGPPVHGTLHVDFWVFRFEVKFGDSSIPRPPSMLLAAFIELALQTDYQGSKSCVGPITADTQLSSWEPQQANSAPSLSDDLPEDDSWVFVLSVELGVVPSNKVDSKPSGGDEVVRSVVFRLTTDTCNFAIQNDNIVTPRPCKDQTGNNGFVSLVAGTTDHRGDPIPVKG
jgi:hypothetical protein